MSLSDSGLRKLLETGVAASLTRNLKREDELADADARQNHRAIWGQSPPTSDDEMILVDSPVTIESPRNSGGSALLKAAAGAALLATGVGGGVGLSMLLDGAGEAAQTIINQSDGPEYLLQLGDPEP